MPAKTPADHESPGESVDTQLVEHAPPARLLAQRGLFSGPSKLVSDDMYARVERGLVTRQRHRLDLQPHATASTNTYFGRFHASYWQRWTVCTEVRAEVVLTGTGRVAVIAGDMHQDTRTVAVQRVDAAKGQRVELIAKIDRFLDGGSLWLEFETQDGTLSVEQVRWTVDPPAAVRPTAVVICTFNRVEDCLNTMAALAGDPEPLDALDAVYVVDQGSDPVESRPRFAELQAALGEKLRYLRQPNLGGAGGFTRGLYEVTEISHADHANVLFMDDDVLCEPEITVRLTAFANRTVDPVIVGGQMLNLLHPNFLHVGAEWADLENLAPGNPSKDALETADLTALREDGKPNLQDRRVDAGYNGWWSCLIPSEIVKAVGYPLPLFFQWDDVEFGYRAREHGFATVTLPGAAVWHADFMWKDWDDWHRYFNLRNSLITTALHSHFNGRHIARVLAAQLTRYLLSMQYGLAATLIKAVDEFLAGPDVLRDGGVAAAAEIRKLRAEYPETFRHPAAEVPGVRQSDLPMVPAGPEPSNKRAVLVKRLVYAALGRSVHHSGTIPNEDATWWHVSLFDTAVVTDASQEGVRVRRKDRDLMIRLAKEGGLLLRRLIREAPAVRAAYRAAMPELTSRENWKRLYEL